MKTMIFEKGTIPPQALELEEAVLGALLIDSRTIYNVFDILVPEVFYKDAHKEIYMAIIQLFNSSEAIDLLTVSSKLRKNGKIDKIGGDFYLIQLTKKISSGKNIEFHARILLQKYTQRELIKSSHSTIEACYDETTDVFETIDSAYSNLNKVSELTSKKREEDVSTLMDKIIEKSKKIRARELEPGLPTPFHSINNNTGGWQPTDLIIIAARPSIGKTSLALKFGSHLAFQGKPVAIFSLEMSASQLVQRIFCQETGINSEYMRIKGLSFDEIDQAKRISEKIKQAPLYIDETAAIHINELKAKAKRLKAKNAIELVIVDYIQLVRANGGNREQEVAKVSSELKALAKELEVPIIALSQLSRECESRAGLDKRPQLRDLRESGAIEQDADVVMFIFRPEYYKIETWGDDYQNMNTKDTAEYIISKNRNGAAPIRNLLTFEKASANFKNIANSYEVTEDMIISF
jgi:replicative DNA helicase